MSYTPGPWSLDSEMVENGNALVVVAIPAKRLIAKALIPATANILEAEANARLIAMAPELLDLLKRYVRDDERPSFSMDRPTKEAIAAIAKATKGD